MRYLYLYINIQYLFKRISTTKGSRRFCILYCKFIQLIAFWSILQHFRAFQNSKYVVYTSIQPLSNINLSYYLSIQYYIRGQYSTIVFIALKFLIFNIFILDLSRTIYSFIISYSPLSTLVKDYLVNNAFSFTN